MRTAILGACALLAASASAAVPQRVIVLAGDSTSNNSQVMHLLYDSREFEFHEPNSPRFLFLDREGKIALGIGGQFYGTMFYDFDGISNAGTNFVPYDISSTSNASQMNWSANNSKVFLHLGGHDARLGYYQMYIQAGFSGPSSAFRLKQAWMGVGAWQVGLALSTFCDPAGPATVDTQGSNGQVSLKNVHISYRPQLDEHWRLGIALEAPSASYTLAPATSNATSQRVPDVPTFVEYTWDQHASHIRLSGIVRNLAYMADGLKFTPGYGVQVSSNWQVTRPLSVYADATYGRGIAAYINDLGGNGLDLIPSASDPAKLIAPRLLALAGSLHYDITPSLFANVVAGYVRLYDTFSLGPDAYRHGVYFSANAFYTLLPNCLIGLEYAHGTRNPSMVANRLTTAMRLSF